MVIVVSIFFFQAEDGIRDSSVTGVQTCALPIRRLFVPSLLLITRGFHPFHSGPFRWLPRIVCRLPFVPPPFLPLSWELELRSFSRAQLQFLLSQRATRAAEELLPMPPHWGGQYVDPCGRRGSDFRG